ncbi:MAG: Holliday junction branch migration protein RuvA [Candidatus Saccharibacteria bacterium]|nr:Holliday junction branch migration protein RuvA [Candidatus Saccharibacteria bacterium]
MIATLEGIIDEQLLDSVILNVQGVGYGVAVTVEDHGQLTAGKPAKLFIYEHIRENSYDLFGFVGRDTKQLFELLLGVNGVGPKMAMSILSIGNSSEVRSAIAGGDTKLIQRANGVGKRVAERVVVDLKDKVGLTGVDLADTGLLLSESTAAGDEAAQALMSLGYSPADAMLALKSIDSSLSTEERIKLALKGKP